MPNSYLNWKFKTLPEPKDMEAVLGTVPAWNGSSKTLADYMEFIVPISGYDKETKGQVYRLYVMVAGKMKILADAHMVDGKHIPITEAPQLKWVGNMVIAEGTMTSPIYGTVFEAATGVTDDKAKGADQTNPVENAMTSWRGRAATALCGAGIMPFAIASMEEMMMADDRAEGGERVLTPAAVTPQERTPAETPAKSAEQTRKTNGGMTFQGAKSIIDGMKKRLGTEENWIAACKEFIETNELKVSDDSIEEAMLHLSSPEFGKLNIVVSKMQKAKRVGNSG